MCTLLYMQLFNDVARVSCRALQTGRHSQMAMDTDMRVFVRLCKAETSQETVAMCRNRGFIFAGPTGQIVQRCEDHKALLQEVLRLCPFISQAALVTALTQMTMVWRLLGPGCLIDIKREASAVKQIITQVSVTGNQGPPVLKALLKAFLRGKTERGPLAGFIQKKAWPCKTPAKRIVTGVAANFQASVPPCACVCLGLFFVLRFAAQASAHGVQDLLRAGAHSPKMRRAVVLACCQGSSCSASQKIMMIPAHLTQGNWCH